MIEANTSRKVTELNTWAKNVEILTNSFAFTLIKAPIKATKSVYITSTGIMNVVANTRETTKNL